MRESPCSSSSSSATTKDKSRVLCQPIVQCRLFALPPPTPHPILQKEGGEGGGLHQATVLLFQQRNCLFPAGYSRELGQRWYICSISWRRTKRTRQKHPAPSRLCLDEKEIEIERTFLRKSTWLSIESSPNVLLRRKFGKTLCFESWPVSGMPPPLPHPRGVRKPQKIMIVEYFLKFLTAWLS